MATFSHTVTQEWQLKTNIIKLPFSQSGHTENEMEEEEKHDNHVTAIISNSKLLIQG